MADMSAQIQDLYLEYAVAVVTGRALPDARDGLKPVQRRILYAMARDLKLSPGAKHRKSAAIVGRVLGAYHPHGDQSVYDAMVRMAQDFSMRYPLVDPQGNFGSIDGDNAASMRYTEARLAPMAERLLGELGQDTVDHDENYDATTQEPVVLPAEIPNLLMNGAQGIAVGMATNIPPHNATELLDALIDLCNHPERRVSTLIKNHINGPDFPSGGVIVEGEDAIIKVYEEGTGSLTMRGQWELEDMGRGRQRLVFTELPYQVNKADLFEKCAQAVYDGEIPQVSEVRDESTDDIRLVFDLKKGEDVEVVLAYLFKHTALETKFHYNLTALIPLAVHEGEDPSDPDTELTLVPLQSDLVTLLKAFLQHRVRTVTRRTRHALKLLQRRIHILEGFEAAFADVDRLVALVRQASSKSDARENVQEAFGLDHDQAEAVVAMALHRLASTEVADVLAELADKRAQAEKLKTLLGDATSVRSLVREEFIQVKQTLSDARKTRIEAAPARSYEYEEEAYIQSQDVHVILTREGWVRAQKSYSDLSALRCRDGDEVGWALACNTRDVLVVFTSRGKAYSVRVDELELTTGYGSPVQTFLSFEDGERVVAAHVCLYEQTPTEEMISVTSDGQVVRFALEGYHIPSKVTGRLYQRIKAGARVLNVECYHQGQEDRVVLATRDGKGISFDPEECRVFSGAGYGLTAINLGKKDEVLAYMLLGPSRDDNMYLETNRGAERMLTHQTYKSQRRGGKGFTIIKRGHLVVWRRPVVQQL